MEEGYKLNVLSRTIHPQLYKVRIYTLSKRKCLQVPHCTVGCGMQTKGSTKTGMSASMESTESAIQI